MSADYGNAAGNGRTADFGQENDEANVARLRSAWRAGGRTGCLWR